MGTSLEENILSICGIPPSLQNERTGASHFVSVNTVSSSSGGRGRAPAAAAGAARCGRGWSSGGRRRARSGRTRVLRQAGATGAPVVAAGAARCGRGRSSRGRGGRGKMRARPELRRAEVGVAGADAAGAGAGAGGGGRTRLGRQTRPGPGWRGWGGGGAAGGAGRGEQGGRKWKTVEVVTTVEQGHERISLEEFQKMLDMQYPYHKNHKHSARECFGLKRAFSGKGFGKPPRKEDKDKEPRKGHLTDEDLQMADSTINMIYGIPEQFKSKRKQKLTQR
ncbi:uncharacterized protein LOC101760662 [Setaria italica]|uniref:uncharacterized protein LOC101760662 n=1 Tax=Setaria italica TaxID=4555 RepID=UPI000647D3F9|nr:uncharacterized protein LOC101760662 [Setaria italica]